MGRFWDRIRTTALAAALAVALVSPGCGVGLRPSLLPEHVLQRHAMDCMVASLATMGGWSYERVEAARIRLGIDYAGGLTGTQVIALAAGLGLPLELDLTPNPVMEDGILVIRLADRPLPYHAVYLLRGWIYDPARDRPLPWVLWLEAHPESEFRYLLKATIP